MASTRRIPVLNFHGNGNIVHLGGLKPQAQSSKPQAPSKARQIDARQYVLLTGLEKATSHKHQAINETVPHNDIEEAQASSHKHQAT